MRARARADLRARERRLMMEGNDAVGQMAIFGGRGIGRIFHTGEGFNSTDDGFFV